MPIRYLSTFSGVGGLDRGLDLAGWTCVGQVEADPFCRFVLQKEWSAVPKWIDVNGLDFDELARICGSIDAVVGGPPCQPSSVAGKRMGCSDVRWLWPAFLRIVRAMQPMWVLAENPPGLISLDDIGIDWVLSELEAAGYETQSFVLGADDVGATHRRKRVFVVANACSRRRNRGTALPRRSAIERIDADRADVRRQLWPAYYGHQRRHQEPPLHAQRGLGCRTHGLPRRLVSLEHNLSRKAFGNAVVPECTYHIGRAIRLAGAEGI